MQVSAPFYSQHWDLDAWAALGFANREAATYWQGSSCGILCLKMAVEGVSGRTIRPTAELISHGVRFGAYDPKEGWKHSGLAKLAHLFGAAGIMLEPLLVADVKGYLDAGCLPIVSITSAFEPQRTWKDRLFFWRKQKRGGHLALVTGYDAQGFYVHHTSVRPAYNWENRLISFPVFEKGFAERGVVILPPAGG